MDAGCTLYLLYAPNAGSNNPSGVASVPGFYRRFYRRHGIPAALTVNRLQGELARLVAEHPGLGAGTLLELPNQYSRWCVRKMGAPIERTWPTVPPSQGRARGRRWGRNQSGASRR